MATIERFEDLEAWKRAREVVRAVYRFTAEGDCARDFGFRDQIRRSAVSIMSNIAEGFERGGDKEFHNFLSIAKGSCGETRAQLYVALDQGYVNKTQFDLIYELLHETGKLIGGLMKYLNRSPLRGSKYRNE
jgi:four helix bundle protein